MITTKPSLLSRLEEKVKDLTTDIASLIKVEMHELQQANKKLTEENTGLQNKLTDQELELEALLIAQEDRIDELVTQVQELQGEIEDYKLEIRDLRNIEDVYEWLKTKHEKLEKSLNIRNNIIME